METKSASFSTFGFQFIRVMVVDDHKIIADGLERLINESDDIRVSGKTHTVAGCLELLKDHQPDVLLLDISMPDGNGIDLCPGIKEKYPQVKVLMLTSYSEFVTITRALNAGADGYVLKNAEMDELIEGIRTVASGKRFVCGDAETQLKNKENNLIELTRRETELLHLIAKGLTLSQLADRMCLGINTIRDYRQKLNIKLDAHNSIQLLQNARTLKLL